MIDEDYVSPEFLREFFTKEKGKPYKFKESVLQKYYLNGCLGKKAEDRLMAGELLFVDFVKSGIKKSGSIDTSKPKVDCSPYQNMTPSQYYHFDQLTKALKTIKETNICRLVFDVVLLEVDRHLKHANRDWTARQHNKEINRLLCSGLDNLIEFYGGKKNFRHKIVGFSWVKVI